MTKILQVINPRYSFSDTMKLPTVLEALEFNSCGDAYVKSKELVAAGCGKSCLDHDGWWIPNRSYRKNPNETELRMYSVNK